MFTVLSFPFTFARVEAQPEGWRTLKSDHFILHYEGDDRSFSDTVLRKAEAYYDDIANALGYSRRSNFWLWDNRCLIYLYGSKEAYASAAKQAAWSSGFAMPSKRTIVSYEGAREFLDSVLPHELAHLIFRDFVGLKQGSVPLWLDEGLAMAQEQGRRAYFNELVKKIISEQKWIPLDRLSEVKYLHGTSTEEAAVFYAEAQSLVRFLLGADIPSRFVDLCRDLRDGDGLELALAKNYPRIFPSISDLEQAWVAANG